MIKVIAFDTFGTVFDLKGVDKDEIKAYISHIHQPEWSPLVLPKSWEQLRAFPDAKEGIALLRTKYTVVTCSNGPLGLLIKASKFNGISWDGIIPLELSKVFKPNLRAYQLILDVLSVHPSEVLFVTANATFGDIEGSSACGMNSVLIRNDTLFQTIIELGNQL